ncbi:MAG: hypothetical protein KA066_00200 [Candidatus Pacebacteria bacterium]|nr:hypothetical protein [Candidatus Paceibacterota bacterium]
MSSLKFNERNLLERILEMKTGYVSDFSDRTFREFVLETTGIDILTEPYAEGGTSKANRLRTFWVKESDETVATLIEPLLEHALRSKTDFDRELHTRDEHLFIEARKIIQRLKDEPAPVPSIISKPAVKNASRAFTPPNRSIQFVLNVIFIPIYLIYEFVKDICEYAYKHLVQVLGIALALLLLHFMGVIKLLAAAFFKNG